MSLKPTQRLKKRYIGFEFQGSFSEQELSRALYRHALKFFGEYGFSFRTLKLIEFDGNEGTLLVDRDGAGEALGMLALISELDRMPARMIARKTSGTLKALKEKDKD